MVLGPDRSVYKTTTTSTTLGNSSQTAIQSKVSPKYTISQSSCLASGLETKLPQDSQSQWQRELRHLKDFHLEGSMNQGGQFLNHGAKRIRWISNNLLSPQSQIFLPVQWEKSETHYNCRLLQITWVLQVLRSATVLNLTG